MDILCETPRQTLDELISMRASYESFEQRMKKLRDSNNAATRRIGLRAEGLLNELTRHIWNGFVGLGHDSTLLAAMESLIEPEFHRAITEQVEEDSNNSVWR